MNHIDSSKCLHPFQPSSDGQVCVWINPDDDPADREPCGWYRDDHHE